MPYKDLEKQKAAQAASYQRNKEAVIARSVGRARAQRKRLQEMKEASPCTDCGVNYPYYVMQYDHVSGEKDKDLSYLITAASWERIMIEIAKCELVCANCHSIRSWRRQMGL